jgi:hypothetical protein
VLVCRQIGLRHLVILCIANLISALLLWVITYDWQ